MTAPSHARKQIRDAAWKALQNLPTTGDNVFQSRAHPLTAGEDGTASEIPGLVIIMGDEAVEIDAVDASVKQARTSELLVIAYAEDETVEDTLDRIAAEVEAALLADVTLGGIVKEIALTGSRKDIGDGDQPNGELRMAFLVSYRTAQGAPNTLIS